MTHAVHQVHAFKVIGDYQLEIQFTDGLVRTIDFEPVLAGELYGPLRDLSVFNAVSVDRDARTLVWPNGADFDPATLHDWPDHEAHMRALAKRWATRSTA
jgi:hypothetical protein